jgi:Peptidase A4 family
MGVFELGKGLSVRTFQPPPEGFDPDNASDRERIVHGVPRCPAPFGALEQRMRTKLKNFKLIEPKFAPREARKNSPSLRVQHGPETSNAWSGAITFPPSGDSMKFVEGTWTMPGEVFALAADGVWYSASTWVGMDGDDGSSDVLQTGCDADVMTTTDGDNLPAQYKPWWEWRPAGSFWITNMLVRAWDELTCLICMHQGSTNQATIFLGNLTTKVGLWFQATAPAGFSLSGNCAEWIVEALAINTQTAELAKYGVVNFMDCNAGTVAGRPVNLSTGKTINMVDESNKLISKATISSPTAVTVAYVYPLTFGLAGS